VLNKIQFIGRLGADPEVRYTPDGTQVTSFRVASDYNRKDASGQSIIETEWLPCVTWGKLADICGQYLAKGRLVYVEGRIKTRFWEDKDGVKRSRTEAILYDMKMLEKKQTADEGSNGANAQDSYFSAEHLPEDNDVPF
jgi:single-strand DNA-binding protein